jgi:Bardet-Biedl syndrome 9 protein
MNSEEYDILRMHLSPSIDDDSEHGWEDVTNAAMTSLLKTCLSKGGKNAATNVSS